MPLRSPPRPPRPLRPPASAGTTTKHSPTIAGVDNRAGAIKLVEARTEARRAVEPRQASEGGMAVAAAAVGTEAASIGSSSPSNGLGHSADCACCGCEPSIGLVWHHTAAEATRSRAPSPPTSALALSMLEAADPPLRSHRMPYVFAPSAADLERRQRSRTGSTAGRSQLRGHDEQRSPMGGVKPRVRPRQMSRQRSGDDLDTAEPAALLSARLERLVLRVEKRADRRRGWMHDLEA